MKWKISGEQIRYGRKTFLPLTCECGRKKLVRKDAFLGGKTRSCGCEKKTIREFSDWGAWRDADPMTRLVYRRFMKIIARCESPSETVYKYYGGRGIKICEKWRNSFTNFIGDMGLPPTSTHSIERIDNDGNYCPENCRWATKYEQARNKRTSVFVEIKGTRKLLIDWCQEFGCTFKLARWRISHGWDAVEALSSNPHRLK